MTEFHLTFCQCFTSCALFLMNIKNLAIVHIPPSLNHLYSRFLTLIFAILSLLCCFLLTGMKDGFTFKQYEYQDQRIFYAIYLYAYQMIPISKLLSHRNQPSVWKLNQLQIVKSEQNGCNTILSSYINNNFCISCILRFKRNNHLLLLIIEF